MKQEVFYSTDLHNWSCLHMKILHIHYNQAYKTCHHHNTILCYIHTFLSWDKKKAYTCILELTLSEGAQSINYTMTIAWVYFGAACPQSQRLSWSLAIAVFREGFRSVYVVNGIWSLLTGLLLNWPKALTRNIKLPKLLINDSQCAVLCGPYLEALFTEKDEFLSYFLDLTTGPGFYIKTTNNVETKWCPKTLWVLYTANLHYQHHK